MLPAAGFTVAILALTVVVILLARASESRLTPDPDGGAWLDEDVRLGITELYVNVLASQLLVAVGVVGLLWVAGFVHVALRPVDLGMIEPISSGIILGILLYLANQGSVHVLDRFGIGYSEALRASLAPTTARGWIGLFVVVLPTIAIAEELLFRAALIGGLAASTGVSPWLFVVLSSACFALGHGIQGAGGVAVTGVLGGVLGVAYVISGSFLLVVVAHYVINALEFAINEGLDIEGIPGTGG